jgi:hypothetical protein
MIKITSPLSQADTTLPQFKVGTRLVTSDGNEYIYMPGTTSVEQYDAVYFTASGSVTRLVPSVNTGGGVGVAQAAITANKYGWFQVYGLGWVQCGTTTSSGSPLFASGTTGCVDGTISAGDMVIGMYGAGTGGGGANGTIKVRMNYPYRQAAVAML